MINECVKNLEEFVGVKCTVRRFLNYTGLGFPIWAIRGAKHKEVLNTIKAHKINIVEETFNPIENYVYIITTKKRA